MPIDDVVAVDIAAGIAERADLPVATNLANLSVSLAAEKQLVQAGSDTIAKPQIVQPSADSREIESYTTQTGDSVTEIAAQFGISPETLKWANDLSSDALEPGRKLVIPPIDGVVHEIKSGETVKAIADKYKASPERIIAYNDLELSGLKGKKEIIIPGGNLPLTERPGYVAPAPISTYTASYGAITPWGNASASVGNRYAFGNCTWYAYERRAELGRPIGSFWGNAATWALLAQSAGYRVDKTPEPGALAQWNAYSGGWINGYGHVGVVESVNNDGTITISEMNNVALGGFNIVNTRTLSVGEVSNFIH